MSVFKNFIKEIEKENLERVKDFIEITGVNPTAAYSPSITHTYVGNLKIVKYLLSLRPKFNIDPIAKNNMAIRFAAESGKIEVVKYLISLRLEFDIDPTAKDNHAIILAVRSGQISSFFKTKI